MMISAISDSLTVAIVLMIVLGIGALVGAFLVAKLCKIRHNIGFYVS